MFIHKLRSSRQIFKSIVTLHYPKTTSEYVKPVRWINSFVRSHSPCSQLQDQKGMLLDRFYERNQVNFMCRQYFSRTVTSNKKDDQTKHPIGQLEGTMYISFTCKVCQTKNAHTFSKHAYRKGVVIVTCEGCNNHHLIADNLDWFSHFKGRNIEDFLAERGEKINKGSNFEYVSDQNNH